MAVYLGVYTGLLFIALSIKRNQQVLLTGAAIGFLLFFMGTRYETGCDFQGYLNRFQMLPPGVLLSDALGREEFGFQLILTYVRSIDASYMWVNVIASAIMLINMFVFLRGRHQAMMMLAVLFPILLIQLGMSGLRQGIAVSFLMLACNAFIAKRRLPTLIWILTGSMFHISVLFFLPIVAFVRRKVTGFRMIAAIVVLIPLSLLLLGDRIDVYRARYIDQIYGEMSSGAALIRYAIIMIPFVPFYFYRGMMKINFPREYNLMVLFGLLTVAILPIGLINTVALHRLVYYLMPVSIMTFVYLTYCLALITGQSGLRLLPGLVYGSYSLSWFWFSRHADICYTPYQSYLLL